MQKISLITPSFNQGQFIRETIDSVLLQQYPNLEYWIVDGGSTDDTVSILKSYGKKIHWVSQKDNGQTSAINWGLQQITGDIIGFLNSDDTLLPHCFETVAKAFESKQCHWLIGNYTIVDERGHVYEKHGMVEKYKLFLMKHFSKNLLLSVNNFVPQPSTFWSKKAFEKVGFFDEKLHYTMDYDYWLRLAEHYYPVVCRDRLSQFRLHPESKSVSSRDKMFAEELTVMAKHHPTTLQKYIHYLHSFITSNIYTMID